MCAATLDQRASTGDVGAGSCLGPYELLLPIAQGGMAVVWAARLRGRRNFRKLVALKIIHRSLRVDSRIEQMFLAEAKFASRIEHPNVCSIRELGEDAECLFIAMEWVEGDTLAAIEAQMPAGLPVALATRIGADVALGLSAAHRLADERGRPLGLVHCDVSPQNIMLTPDGHVKVVDFGLVRATAATCPPTDSELLGGKFSFMAPEQANGVVDSRTDVFALGVVLYRLVTGRHPFEGQTALDRFKKMHEQTVPPPAPCALRPECPPALSQVILRAMARDPAERFHSMAALSRALRAALPEIESAACRDELAALARRTTGTAVRARRQAVEDAIRAADGAESAPRAWPEPEPEPVSLPSSVLEELEPPTRPSTVRPVALSSPPSATAPRRATAWLWAGAAAALVAAYLLGVGQRSPVETAHAAGRAPEAPLPSPPPSAEPALPRATAAPPPPSAAPAEAPRVPRRAVQAAPPARAPTPPAARDPQAWRLDPGF